MNLFLYFTRLTPVEGSVFNIADMGIPRGFAGRHLYIQACGNQRRKRAWGVVSFGVVVGFVCVERVFQGSMGATEGGRGCRNSSAIQGNLYALS